MEIFFYRVLLEPFERTFVSLLHGIRIFELIPKNVQIKILFESFAAFESCLFRNFYPEFGFR